jgi:hypothetical protein
MRRMTAGKPAKSSRPRDGHTPVAPPALVQPGTHAEHYAAGKALRATFPRDAHAGWKAPSARRDPVHLVLSAEKGRMRELLPLRHGRMVRTPFTFYRGAALTMAADLATTPSTGIHVQCCGDAHLCNFGGFGTYRATRPSAYQSLFDTRGRQGTGGSGLRGGPVRCCDSAWARRCWSRPTTISARRPQGRGTAARGVDGLTVEAIRLEAADCT